MADALPPLPNGFTLDGGTPPLPQGFTLDAPPAQMGGAMRLPAMAGSSLAKGALESAGAIGDLQDFLGRQFSQGVFNPLHRMITGVDPAANPNPAGLTGNPFNSTPGPDQGSPLNSAHLVGLGQSAGAVNRPDLAPQTTGEHFLSAASEGAGGMLPYLPLAAGGALANAGRGLAQGAAAGASGEGAAEMFPRHPDLARAAGAIVGGLGAGKVLNAGNRVAGAAMGASTPTLDAYRNLGIAPTLAGDVTGSPTLQMIQAYAAKSPGGAGRVHAASDTAVNQWGRALEDTAQGLGNAGTLQQAGEALQMHGKSWLSDFNNASRSAWTNVDMHIPPTTPVQMRNYGVALADIQNAMPNATATARNLQSPLSRNLLDSLLQDTKAAPLTWQDAKAIRTRIGEKLAEPQLVGDTSHAELKRIYGALTDDLQATAATRGPAATQAFNDAATLTRDGHSFIENTLSRVLKGDKISPEQAASAALTNSGNGGTLLSTIRAEMPAAADELAAYKLRDMGLANSGRQNATASALSPGTFVTDRGKLSPEALNALYGADPAVARRVEDLAAVGAAMRNTERFLNTSNTGAHGATTQALTSIFGAPLAALGGYHAGGLKAAAAAALGPPLLAYGPSNLAARITTNPRLTGLWAAPPAATPQSAGLLAGGALYPQLRAVFGALGGQ